MQDTREGNKMGVAATAGRGQGREPDPGQKEGGEKGDAELVRQSGQVET